jgi:hypothetical protein
LVELGFRGLVLEAALGMRTLQTSNSLAALGKVAQEAVAEISEMRLAQTPTLEQAVAALAGTPLMDTSRAAMAALASA